MSEQAKPVDQQLAARTSDRNNSRPSVASRLARSLETRMLGLALVIAIALSVLSPYFLTRNNLFNILDQSVVVGLVAIGMTFVILTAGPPRRVFRTRRVRCHPRPYGDRA